MARDQLETLREKKAQIEEKLKRLKARAKEKARKEDTRRKIIAGALALEHAEIDAEFGRQLHSILARFVGHPEDRALFGLPPKVGDTPGTNGEGPENGA